MISLGIDTSNYTTSCALYDSLSDTVIQEKQLLPVKEGEKGIRQSDAVFHHTQALPVLIRRIMEKAGEIPGIIGFSDRPRDAEGSYMPCFTVGSGAASSIASVMKIDSYGFSHQSGHIMAALYSCGRTDLASERFIAFHVSGGTTEMLLVSPDDERGFKAVIIGKTLDLNCGQAIDRTGVMMGLSFPCGKELEKLAEKSAEEFRPRVFVKDGCCSFSGLENKCREMLGSSSSPEDTAKFCLDYISHALVSMTVYAREKYPSLPVVYAGGVMSDMIIRNKIESTFENVFFAGPVFSRDNAAGVALLAYFNRRRADNAR